MDMKTALTYRGPFEEAYQQSREAEIVNQQRVAQAQQLLQEARLKAEEMEMKKRMEPIDVEYKKAMTQELLDRSKKYGGEKPYDLARASSAQREQAIPALAAMSSTPEEFFNYLSRIDPDAANALRRSPDPSKAIETYLQEARSISKPYSSLLGSKERADATRNTAELNFHASKYRADAMVRAKEIGAAAAKSGQAAPSVDKLYAQIVIDDMKNGKITQEQGAEALLNFRSAPQISKPNVGIAAEVKPGGGIGIANKPQPAAPSYPPGNTQPQAAQTTPASDFDAKWKMLKKGEKLVGPDGKTYVKK